MQIIIRLIGYYENINNNRCVYELCFTINVFNFEIFKDIFKQKYSATISNDDLSICTLTCGSKNLKKETIEDNKNSSYKCMLFTTNTEVKSKLIMIFKLSGYVVPIDKINDDDSNNIDDDSNNNIDDSNNNIDDSNNMVIEFNNMDDDFNNMDDNISDMDTNFNMDDNISDSDTISIDTIEQMDDNISIEQMDAIEEQLLNTNFIDPIIINPNLELLDDPDFIHLLKIYYDKPNLITSLYKYINSCAIQISNNIDKNIMEETPSFTLNETNFEMIKKLNFGFDDSEIIEALTLNNNHINLSISYLLNK
jgi:hypothetical protein